jgi:AcrR family transcriptional regulator
MSETVQHRMKELRELAYREAALEGAEAVFAEHGFAGAKMAQIAAAARISLATLYAVFPGKEQLHRAVHEWRAEQVIERTARQLPGALTPVEALLTGSDAYVRFQLDHPNYLRLTLREAPSWSRAQSIVHPEQLHAWNLGMELAVQVCAEGIAAGVFVDEPPAQHARMLIATMQVILAEWFDNGMTGTADEVAQRVRRALLRALVVPSAQPGPPLPAQEP